MAIILLGLVVLAFNSVAEDATDQNGRSVFVKAVKVGQPTLKRWPAGNPLNSMPRSVWDMRLFRNRIYIGSGDYWNNKGPVDIWSLGPDGFLRECTVPDEMVYRFFEADGKLVVPGADPREDWSFGNLYVKDGGREQDHGWKKLRTIPKALHVFDFALLKGKWYVVASTRKNQVVYASPDQGRTWKALPVEAGGMLGFNEFILLTCLRGTTLFDGEKSERVAVRLFPPENRLQPVLKSEAFLDGVVYVTGCSWMMEGPQPLYYLTASAARSGGSAVRVERFKDDLVRNVVVRDRVCYVMTAERIGPDAEDCRARIYLSGDLKDWAKVVEVALPGLPYSFEYDGRNFYVGLGFRNVGDKGWNAVGEESGSIWRIE